MTMTSDPVAVKRRKYNMANRSRQAAVTRRRIVEAAARLFLQDGYAATSIDAIAAEAGVAVPTVYAAMKTKQDILWAVIELSVRGDAGDVPLAAPKRWRQMEAEPEPRNKLAMFARMHREICDREAAVFVVLETAAVVDEEIRSVLHEKEEARYKDQTRVARSLRRSGRLRTGMSVKRASDIIWTLASERTYLALVHDRGWSGAQYETWLTDQLVSALLPG
jgi:TetR/AcrR family transcriptional regulator of autoinduction and epiphytic fitness